MDEQRLINLVEKAINQDERAFEELFQYYYPSVYKAAIKLCKNDADAQDIAQLTFLQVRKSIHTLERPSYFPLWINRICVNKCKNLFRDNRNQLYDEEYMKYFNMAVEERRDHISEASLYFRADHEVLMNMIASLSKEHQAVLEMIYFKQLNQEEAAALLHIPVGTVKSRTFAARNALKGKIEAYEQQEGVQLNFHAESLGAVFASMYLAKQQAWVNALSLVIKPSWLKQGSRVLCGSMGNYIIVACVSVLAFGILGMGRELLASSSQREVEQEKAYFHAVSIDDYVIDNEVDAYYLLKGYAYDEDALRKLDKDTLHDMLQVYEALKESNQYMYQQLRSEGWTTSFEQVLNQ